MKRNTLLVVCAITVALSTKAWASESTNTEVASGLGLSVGYRSVSLKDTTYAHNTHPDDWFLPNAGAPGSAGMTSLDGKDIGYASLGFAYEGKIASPLFWNIGAGGLFGGGARDDHQNVNDPRPAYNAAFIYSKALPYGFYGDIGLSYKIEGFSLGVEGSITATAINSGWDRYSSDQTEENRWFFSPVIGPSVGYQFTEWLQAKGALEFGEHSRQFFLELCIGSPSDN